MTTTIANPAKAALERYIETINSNDFDAVIGLLADEVRWIDPHGSGPLRGPQAVREAFSPVFRTLHINLDVPIKGAGDSAAMAYTWTAQLDGAGIQGRSIAVVTVDADGLISRFESYWGPEDIGSTNRAATA